MPATFELLTANVARRPYANESLLNAAASDASRTAGISMPKFDSGLTNFYMARLGDGAGDLSVLTLPVDALAIPGRASLARVDAEGHEMSVLCGVAALLVRDQRALIVQDNSPDIAPFLRRFGNGVERLQGSSNAMYRWSQNATAGPDA